MPRRTTARKKDLFLDGLERGLRVDEAAKHAGVTRGTPYQWARDDDQFNRAWTTARELRQDMLLDAATDNALEGSEFMQRFLINRRDRQLASHQEETIGEILIIPADSVDDSGEVHDFMTLE